MKKRSEKFYIVEKQYRQNGIQKYCSIVFISKTKKRALKLINSDKQVKAPNDYKYEIVYLLSKYEQKSIEETNYIASNLMQYTKIYY